MEQTKQKNSKYIFLALTLLFLFVYLVINIPHITIITENLFHNLVSIILNSLNFILNSNPFYLNNILLFIFECFFKILINLTSCFVLTTSIIFYVIYIFKALDKKLFKILSFVFILMFCFINITNLFRSSFVNILNSLSYLHIYKFALLELSVIITSRFLNFVLVGLNFVAIISIGFSILFCIIGHKFKLPFRIISIILLCLLLIDSFNTYCLEYGFATLISTISYFIMYSEIIYKTYTIAYTYLQIFMICSHSVYLIVITSLFIISLICLIKNKSTISKSVLFSFIIIFVILLILWLVYLGASCFGFIVFYEKTLRYFIQMISKF